MTTISELLMSVPTANDLFAECGSLAGAVYNNRVFTYLRRAGLGQREIVVVANGLVIDHYFSNSAGGSRREGIAYIGRWSWGLTLKQKGFVILRSQSLASWYHEMSSAAELSQSVQQS